ncbi:type II DNA topoisomerase [Ascobolus immersus RN42]|uniref:DNA topoisomerase 2 n=1 Tax=Ascobolus immersus RN42 TaxID=1160509 RepID=A0A3N4I1Q3_ASCIM|nr:type II DNA topoisomerase [Ascobolus immersus RN42]
MSSVSDYDEGDNFSPEPVKKPAAKKAAPKKPAAPRKPAAKKRAADDDDDDAGSDFGASPPQAKKAKKAAAPRKTAAKKTNYAEDDDDEMDVDDQGTSQNSTLAEKAGKYEKLSQIEHILRRPDTYIGEVEMVEKSMWVYNSEDKRMEWRKINYVPGLYKIFDEVMVNAADNKVRDKSMNTIKVEVDKEKGMLSVWNNGAGIPIAIHEKEKIWVPELIFAHLLTSSNYDDNEKKVTGGRNGYGAKLANIYSTKFIVETADKHSKKKYKQEFTKNMTVFGKPEIKENKKGEEYTKITFFPELHRFAEMQEFNEDFIALVKKRVYDMAGCLKGVKVFLNGERIILKDFRAYMDMFVEAIHRENGGGLGEAKPKIYSEVINDRWEVGFAVSDGTFHQVSFVNSIATPQGGNHVNVIADQLCDRITAKLKKLNKGGATLKPAQIKQNFFLFVNAQIENPAFSSQTKEQLTSRPSTFGSKYQLGDKFLKDCENSGVLTNILEVSKAKADKALAKSDGKRRSRISNAKLVDANKAGTKEGWKCTLILTEGDSAMSLAISGIAALESGRDYYGVFPLRGKVLNVRDASLDQITKNAEIQNIKEILGLKHKFQYTKETAKSNLRYGHLMIMTDQDHDGSHIKGLLINFFESQYPSLLRLDGFLVSFITPIVRVFKGNKRNHTESKDFFTMPEFEYWRDHTNQKGWQHKYYKGLATSTSEDAKLYFSNLDKHLKVFHTMDEEGSKAIELAFSKKMADQRKDWLAKCEPGTFYDYTDELIKITDFVNKELILFSMADNIRSIPSVLDGLKPSSRKCMFTCFIRNLQKEIKVAELAASVSEKTAYQHGAVSLEQTIINLAQDFTGSNNMNILRPEGAFGTRIQGGKDAGSARYIYTLPEALTRKVFSPLDDPLLKYNKDDGKRIDPDFYIPILPLILVNGADGIGTGWSTSIPNFNPDDIVENINRWIDGEELQPMKPWYRGFKGTIEEAGAGKFKVSGIIRQIDATTVLVEELPVKLWTQDFKEWLESVIKAEKAPAFIQDYNDNSSPHKIEFTITLASEAHMKAALEEGLENKFKLTRQINTTNIVAFDSQGRICRYDSPLDVMKEFCNVRLKFYHKRKEYMIGDLERTLRRLTNQARFVKMIIDKQLTVNNRKKKDLMAELKQLGFAIFSDKEEAKKAGEMENTVENPDDHANDGQDEGEAVDGIPSDGYNYLLGMALWSLTKERVEKLNQAVNAANEEMEILLKKSPKDLWRADLRDFQEAWKAQCQEWEENAKDEAKTGKKGKKSGKLNRAPGEKNTKKKKDDDDDFEVKPKKRAPAKPKAGAEPQKGQAKIETLFQKAAAKNEPEKEPTKIAPIFQKVARAAATKKKKIVELSDEDEEMADLDDILNDDDDDELDDPVEVSSPKIAPKPKPAPKKSKLEEILSDLDDDDDLPIPKQSEKAKPKPRAKAAAAATASQPEKKKSLFDISDSDDDIFSAPVSKPAPKPISEEVSLLLSSDSEAEPAAKPAKKAAAKPKPAAKKKSATQMLLDDDEEEDDDRDARPPPAPKARARAAPKKPAAKKKVLSDDEDEVMEDVAEDSDEVLPTKGRKEQVKKVVDLPLSPVRPRARAARAAAKSVPKYDFLSDDEEEEEEFNGGDSAEEDEFEDDDE